MKTKYYTLFLHDFSNLAVQILETSDSVERLHSIAESMNQVFNLGGYKDELYAEVLEENDQ